MAGNWIFLEFAFTAKILSASSSPLLRLTHFNQILMIYWTERTHIEISLFICLIFENSIWFKCLKSFSLNWWCKLFEIWNNYFVLVYILDKIYDFSICLPERFENCANWWHYKDRPMLRLQQKLDVELMQLELQRLPVLFVE